MKNDKHRCTNPNCDCAEKEMQRQGTDMIRDFPCLKVDMSAANEITTEFKRSLSNETKVVESVPVKTKEQILSEYNPQSRDMVMCLTALNAMEEYASQLKNTDAVRVITDRIVELNKKLKPHYNLKASDLFDEIDYILKLIQP